MFLIFLLYYFDDYGVEYDSSEKKILIQLPSYLINFIIPASVESIPSTSRYDSPFYPCRDTLQTLIFEENSKLKTIGQFLFSELKYIESIDMSNCLYLETISYYCFSYCYSLKKLILPSNLKIIEDYAFFYNTKLETITIPDSVISIGNFSFRGSYLIDIQISENSQLEYIGRFAFESNNIKTFYIPKNVKSIGIAPFTYASIKYFTIHPDNKYYTLDSEGKAVIQDTKICFAASGITDPYIIRNFITELENYSFYGCRFSEIKFEEPCKIKNISIFCFTHTPITQILIPEGIERIENYAFSYCSNLQFIEIPESIVYFGDSIFQNCHPDLQIMFSNPRFNYTNGMIIVDNITIYQYIGGYNKNFVIPKTIKYIEKEAFNNNIYVETIEFEEGSEISKFGDYAFAQSIIRKISIPNSLRSIGIHCFEQSYLEEINLSQTNITEIPSFAFASCSKLKQIKLPIMLEIIQNSSFINDISLIEVDFESTPLIIIGSYAFQNTCLIKIEFPFTLESIEEHAFENTKLEVVHFPDLIELTNLSEFAFANNLKLYEINISNSVTKIGSYCFFNCNSIESIAFGQNINEIGDYCFAYCSNLKTFTLGEKTEILYSYSFFNCINLEEFIIPQNSNLKTIYPNSFKNCPKFLNIKTESDQYIYENNILMSDNQTKIIFYNPNSLMRTVFIPYSVEIIGDYAFYESIKIVEVFNPSGYLVSIGYQAFMNCDKLSRLILPSNLKAISNEAFFGCTNLKCGCVTIPKEMVERAIQAGISESVLTDKCLQSQCSVYYYQQRTCRERFIMHKSFIFDTMF